MTEYSDFAPEQRRQLEKIKNSYDVDPSFKAVPVGMVYATFEYDAFKHLPGNRAINPAAVKKIQESLQKAGRQNADVIINEFNEVIDGQHRIETLRKEGRPVTFVYQRNAGIKDVIAQNTTPKKWKAPDFLNCHNDLGNEDYHRLYSVINDEKYKFIPFGVKLDLALGQVARGKKEEFENGDSVFSEEKYQRLINFLDYLSVIYVSLDKKKKIGKSVCLAIWWLLKSPEIDRERLTKTLLTNLLDMRKADEQNIDKVLIFLDRAYNYKRLEKNRTNLRGVVDKEYAKAGILVAMNKKRRERERNN